MGSAVDLAARIRCHRFDLRNGRHHNRYLSRAWVKYGANDFSVSILTFCIPKDLLAKEQFFIDLLGTVQPRGYNLNPKAGSSLGLKRSREACESMSKCRLGKPLKEETKRKLSRILKRLCVGKAVPRSMIEKAALFNRGRPLSQAHRDKIGNAHRGIKRPEGMMKRLAEFNRGKKRLKKQTNE